MSSPRRRARRVIPKSRPIRPATRPDPEAAAEPGSEDIAPVAAAGAAAVRPATRAQNRAAKRAATGVRAKNVRGRVSGRQSRSYSPAIIGLAIAAALAVLAVIFLGNPFGNPLPSASPAGSGPPASLAAYGDGTCPTSQPAALAAGEKRTVTIETDEGDIVIEVDGSRAPTATGNFVALIECEYYDGTGFHRLVPGFVIQGGDPDGTGSGPGPGYRIQDDPLVGTYKRGTVAMARTAQPNSQGSQFFVVLSDSAHGTLTDPQVLYPYAILGEVVSGMEVVDAIAAKPTDGDSAIDPVVMTRVTVSGSVAPSASPAASPATSAAPSPAASAAPSP